MYMKSSAPQFIVTLATCPQGWTQTDTACYKSLGTYTKCVFKRANAIRTHFIAFLLFIFVLFYIFICIVIKKFQNKFSSRAQGWYEYYV